MKTALLFIWGTASPLFGSFATILLSIACIVRTPILLTKQQSNFINFGLTFSEEKVHHCYFLS